MIVHRHPEAISAPGEWGGGRAAPWFGGGEEKVGCGSGAAGGSRASGGFTIMEILLAMAIFAVGFAALAAVFPAGARMQKTAVSEVMAHQAAENARAMLRGRPFDLTQLKATEVFADGKVHALSEIGSIEDFWEISDRSYPSSVTDPFYRHFYWVPLIQDINGLSDPKDWVAFVFILQKEANEYSLEIGGSLSHSNELSDKANWANYQNSPVVPGVRRIGAEKDGTNDKRFDLDLGGGVKNRLWSGPGQTPPQEADLIRAGDWVLDENGQVYTVQLAHEDWIEVDRTIVGDPRVLWFSPPPGADRNSPVKRIIRVTGAVKN